MKTIFGPVPSRRLGRSLGIDVIPSKTCSYDCVYCESGPTSQLTIKREAFVDVRQVMVDLDNYFREYPLSVDVLTFSSAGEPTLYEPLGELVQDIKRQYPSLPLVVLTNGSLLWDARVRRDLMNVDRVIPSLDAATPNVFRKINRHHPILELAGVTEGLEAFGKEYGGQLFIEVLLVSGYNDHPEELSEIRKVIDRIHPDGVELNTVVRPPAYPGICGLSSREMNAAASFFPAGMTNVIGKFQDCASSGKDLNLGLRVVEMVRRRPCTVMEMMSSLGVSLDELNTALSKVLSDGLVMRYVFDGRVYVKAR